MARLSFKIDFGFQMIYSRRQYHAAMKWDGRLVCKNGRILKSDFLEDGKMWSCPCFSPKRIPLDRPEWKITTRRQVHGVAFEVDANEKTSFTLETAAGTWKFTAKDVWDKGRIAWHVGPKYTYNLVVVTREGYHWFYPQLQPGMTRLDADDLGLPVHEWSQQRMGWLAPGGKISLDLDFPDVNKDGEYLIHATVMISPRGYDEPHKDIGDPNLPMETMLKLVGMKETPIESQWHEEMPIVLRCDGVEVVNCRQHFRDHDFFNQLLEDVWLRFKTTPGRHHIEWENPHDSVWMLFGQLTLQACPRVHCQMTLPKWMLTGETLTGRIYATHSDSVTLQTPNGNKKLELKKGWNEFPIKIKQAGTHFKFKAGRQTGEIEAVYDIAEETLPVLVGYDMTIVPHDDNGFMDWLLDYTDRTRLANLVVFRNFLAPVGLREIVPVKPKLLKRWGTYCRTHGITVEAATDFETGVLAKAAGSAMHSAGKHEISGPVYAVDPIQSKESGTKKADAVFATSDNAEGSKDMKEAAERYMAHIRQGVEAAHNGNCLAAFGEASGAIKYNFFAGMDFVRAETMVPHTQHLLSQARAASDAFGKHGWGVHIAVQHPVQPSDMSQCRRYFASLYQAWMMGANMLYEEDSIFIYFKEERQTWCDALTSTKRQMTRDFLRFAKTHPRHGRVNRPIAFIEGRYAAPFNGFGCGPEQTPDYSVWGKFGNCDATWGHRQPEKCRQLLNVLMPGASTIPLRQQIDKRRFFFSGTPYGDFDEAPIEATADFLSQYKLLLNLGWNTMKKEDHAKLLKCVKKGATLLTGIPQFSTHLKRDFLTDMNDLALFRDGDLTELCGFKVIGKNGVFSRQWNAKDREAFQEPELIGMPSHSPEEDGPAWRANIELAPTAEVVAWDALDTAPLVIRNKVGKGYVYTLAFWAYPGHETFQKLSATWLEYLAKQTLDKRNVKVIEPSRDLFWTEWQDENGSVLMLLNTDWTNDGIQQNCRVKANGLSWIEIVDFMEPVFIRVLGDRAISYSTDLHVEILSPTSIKCHGVGKANLTIHSPNDEECRTINFGAGTEVVLELT